MKRWIDFAAEKPEMAEAGHALIYQHRGGLGYLATVRKDGGPRVHGREHARDVEWTILCGLRQ